MIKKKINGIEFLVTEPGDKTVTLGRQYEDEILGKGPLYHKLKEEEEADKKAKEKNMTGLNTVVKKTNVPKSSE